MTAKKENKQLVLPELLLFKSGKTAERVIEVMINRIEHDILKGFGVDNKNQLTEFGLMKFHASLAGRYESIICELIREKE